MRARARVRPRARVRARARTRVGTGARAGAGPRNRARARARTRVMGRPGRREVDKERLRSGSSDQLVELIFGGHHPHDRKMRSR